MPGPIGVTPAPHPPLSPPRRARFVTDGSGDLDDMALDHRARHCLFAAFEKFWQKLGAFNRLKWSVDLGPRRANTPVDFSLTGTCAGKAIALSGPQSP